MTVFNNSGESSTMSDVTSANYINETDKCVEIKHLFTIAFIPLELLVTFFNLTVFAAAARDRRKLQRQTYTFNCVMSTLLSNSVYLLMSIWLTVDYFKQTARKPQVGIMSMEKWIWIICESITASLVVGICANATSLIYVSLDSVVYVGRSGTEWGINTGKQRNAMRFKVRVAVSLVVASWVLPLLITVFTFVWNCAEECHCPSNNFEGENCPREHNCSNMWAPMKIELLMIIIGIWTVQVIGLIILVVNGIRRHYRNQNYQVKNFSKNNVNAVNNGEEETTENRLPKNTPNIEDACTRTKFKINLNRRLKFAVVLTSLLIICTLPGVICTVLDVLSSKVPMSLLVSGLCMLVYCAISPILMLKFLPSLKSSTIKFLISVKNCSCVKSRDSNIPVRTNRAVNDNSLD